MRNYPFRRFVKLIQGYSQYTIYDYTGINGNIDVDFKCFLMDFNDIRRALKEVGLELVPEKHYLKTLVIRDN